MSAPFPIEPGDTVTWADDTGFVSGYFERWNRNGDAVIKVPEFEGRTRNIDPSRLRPCNDQRMLARRGHHIPWPTPIPKPRKES